MTAALIQNDLRSELPSIDRAEGVWLFDTGGKRYFDACSGAVVANIGHAHPHVVAAISAQAAKVTFTHRGAFASVELLELANRLTRLTSYEGAWFVNSGSEAVEACMQFALQYFQEKGEPERTWFLSHAQGYHGNTLGGLSLSGHARRTVVRGLAFDFAVLETPGREGNRRQRSDGEESERLLAAARLAFEQHGTRLAAVVVEPVGGATLGCTVPPDGYLQGLRSLCDEFGALLIADEVMTGLGRTGPPLAVDHWGVRPDLVALGKGLGAGYTPIAAAMVDGRVLDELTRGSGRISGGHTYAGNPLSAATALAVLDVIESENVFESAARIAAHLEAGMRRLADQHPAIIDVRGLGMMWALEFGPQEGRPSGSLAREFAAITQQHGAIVYPTSGGFNDAVSIAPPLTTRAAELHELLAILDRSLIEFAPRRGIL